MPAILVIDDDTRIRELLAEYLSGRDHQVNTAADGASGLLAAPHADLVVLDLMMPEMDGLTVLRKLRRVSQVPVIILTARGDDFDRIVGLELGADDYLPKPFNPRELTARIDAVLRRVQHTPVDRHTAGGLVVHVDQRAVTLHGEPIELTTTEFEILRALVGNAGRVIPREKLMELARGEDYAAFDRSVDVHISHIRRKLGDDPRHPVLLKTVRGVGYVVPRSPR